jgi:uncharacterized membrane protein
MEVNGLPLHPLVVHAVVVLTPLSALCGLAYAAVPRWRWLLRWPLVLLTLAATGAAVLAASAGESLLESRPGLEDLPAVETHQGAGELLRNILFLDLLVVAVSAWWLGGPSALASGKGARRQRGGLDLAVAAVLVVASVVVLYAAFAAGDSGARAVWG